MLEFDHNVVMPQHCFCMTATRHCTLLLSLEQWHLSGLCGDTDEPSGFRNRQMFRGSAIFSGETDV